jgi:transcriptional regulator with XRE-family HTH domain
MPVGDRNGSRARAVMLGAAIRELRESLGWSQSRLAAALCKISSHATVTRENISRWESGKRIPGAWWLRHLATALQVPIEILEQAGVNRRRFITTAAGASVAPLVASDLVEHGFAAALRSRYPSVDDWTQAVASYGRDYMTSGASEIQKRLAADLIVLQQQLDTAALWSVGAKLATLYGKPFPVTTALRRSLGINTPSRSPTDPTTTTHGFGSAVGRPSHWAMRARVSTPPTCWPSRPSPSVSASRSVGSTPSWARRTSQRSVVSPALRWCYWTRDEKYSTSLGPMMPNPILRYHGGGSMCSSR